jgi:hypothetical protein
VERGVLPSFKVVLLVVVERVMVLHEEGTSVDLPEIVGWKLALLEVDEEEVDVTLLEEGVATALLEEEIATALLEEEVATALLEEEFVVAILEEEVEVALLEEDVATALLEEEIATALLERVWNGDAVDIEAVWRE